MLRDWGRLDEALAAYDRTVEDFPENAVARNGRAVVLSSLGRWNEARAALTSSLSGPRTAEDWVAFHISCTIDLRRGASDDLAERVAHAAIACPFHAQRRYFEATVALVRLTLRQARKTQRELRILSARPDFDVGERAALRIMEAHAEAEGGDLSAARRDLVAASNVIPYEEFELRRMRKAVEIRYGLDSAPAPTRPDKIAELDRRLAGAEVDYWVARASRAGGQLLAA